MGERRLRGERGEQESRSEENLRTELREKERRQRKGDKERPGYCSTLRHLSFKPQSVGSSQNQFNLIIYDSFGSKREQTAAGMLTVFNFLPISPLHLSLFTFPVTFLCKKREDKRNGRLRMSDEDYKEKCLTI